MESIPDLIIKKREGDVLSQDNIHQFIQGLMNDQVHHAQLGAMLMAVFLKGMNREEMVALTQEMLTSGEILRWPAEWEGLIVDKHSTGGVGDKVSLPLAPALAVCGMKVPMISGRGLGHTGGTLDKLESIPGYKTEKTSAEMKAALESVGCCIVGQSEKLVPADRILYSFRDITGTVASVPLIVGSIISKKAAEGLNGLVLDVKCGKGSFMKTTEDAERLAHALVATSEGLGIRTTAFITQMDEPIGYTIGNSLEVLESIECLLGKGPKDLEDLVCVEGGEILFLMGKAASPEKGQAKIKKTLHDGSALAKFKEMLLSHGVAENVATKVCSSEVHTSNLLPLSPNTTEIRATETGLIADIDSMKCAEVSAALGAGRTQPGQEVAKDVGLRLKVHCGVHINAGEPWVTVYHRESALHENLKIKLQAAINIVSEDKTSSYAASRVLNRIQGQQGLKVPFPSQ